MRYLMAILVTGCSVDDVKPGDGGQFGEEDIGCVAVMRTALAPTDASPLGFTAQSVLDAVVGEHTTTLDWLALGTSAGLTVSASPSAGGVVEYVEYEWQDTSGQDIAPAYGCANLVEIEVDVDFDTDDGAFAERWSGRVTSAAEGTGAFSVSLDAVAGSFDPWDHAPAGNSYDEMSAWADLTFAAGVSGGVNGQGSGTDGDPSDPEATAFAENVDIATFGQ